MKSGRWDLALAALVALTLWLMWQHTFAVGIIHSIQNKFFPEEVLLKNVRYSCAGNRHFQVLVYADTVHLHLDDGRNFILPEIKNGSSSEYAREDRSIIFRNIDGNSLIEENGTTTYGTCTPGKTNYS